MNDNTSAPSEFAELNALLAYDLEQAGYDARMVLAAMLSLAEAGVGFTFPDRYKRKHLLKPQESEPTNETT